MADSVGYSIAVSRLRRPFLSDRYFFVTIRLRKDRAILNASDFKLLALAFSRARQSQPFFLTAWVFLPDHWHAICAPTYPLTVSRWIAGWRRPFGSAILASPRISRATILHPAAPFHHHCFEPGPLQFITARTCRRTKLFEIYTPQ